MDLKVIDPLNETLKNFILHIISTYFEPYNHPFLNCITYPPLPLSLSFSHPALYIFSEIVLHFYHIKSDKFNQIKC